MKLILFIAKRYLLAKKSHNAINIITLVSIIGVAVGTMALVIVLSVFNGFEKVIMGLFHAFNPDIEVTLQEGKTFNVEDLPAEDLKNLPGVVSYSEVLEESALLTYRDRQHLITLRGIDNTYKQTTGIDTLLINGEFILSQGDNDYLVLGQGVANVLNANINDHMNTFTIYIPRRGHTVSMHPAQAFNASSNFASGIYGMQSEYDTEYVFAPIRLVRYLLEYNGQVSSIALSIDPDYNLSRVQQQIDKITGEEYNVKNRLQQQEFLYQILRSEKLAIYLILTFVLIIATFNVIGSLTMLVIEKKKDISVLWSMGARKNLIKRIFLAEGMLISLTGAITGLILGWLVCFLQIHFELITLQGTGTYIIDAYPVHMQWTDFVYIFFTVILIGFVSVIFPLRRLFVMIQNIRPE